MENLIIKGQITATSNKVNEDYKTDNPTKTAYLTVTDDNIRKAMVNFGLTEYTSKQDDSNFFIIKLPQQLTLVKGNHRSEEHTSELQSRFDLVCRLLLEKTHRHNR